MIIAFLFWSTFIYMTMTVNLLPFRLEHSLFFQCFSSSMVPGSRNPMWGEEFNFFVDALPVQVSLIYPYHILSVLMTASNRHHV